MCDSAPLIRRAPAAARAAPRGVSVSSIHREPEIARPRDAVVSVLTVDDDPRFLLLARDVVEATPGFRPVGEAATGEAALSLVPVLRPELVLMDVRMPGIGGIEAARRIGQATAGRIAVILMSADAHLLACVGRPPGTVGVLRKDKLSPAALRALWAT
jgi:two-component system, NarL family, invasion response regulator UvrY